MTKGNGEGIRGINRRRRLEVERVSHDEPDLLLLGATVAYDRRLDPGRLVLHHLAAPTTQRGKDGAPRFRKRKSRARVLAGKRGLNCDYVRREPLKQNGDLVSE
jgi:hypothetical protein